MFAATDGRVRSMPAAWTDVGESDPFVALAAGRAAVRTEDLLALAALVRELAEAAERRSTGGRRVNATTPRLSTG